MFKTPFLETAAVSYLEVWTLPKNGKRISPPSGKHKQRPTLLIFAAPPRYPTLLHVDYPWGFSRSTATLALKASLSPTSHASRWRLSTRPKWVYWLCAHVRRLHVLSGRALSTFSLISPCLTSPSSRLTHIRTFRLWDHKRVLFCVFWTRLTTCIDGQEEQIASLVPFDLLAAVLPAFLEQDTDSGDLSEHDVDARDHQLTQEEHWESNRHRDQASPTEQTAGARSKEEEK